MDAAPDVQRIIQEVVRCLVERYQPQQVILFGSLAYGTLDKDSDSAVSLRATVGGEAISTVLGRALGIASSLRSSQ